MKAVIQISVSITTPDGEQKIPTEGATQELINRILALEKEVEELKQSRATTGTMGLSQVYGGSNVTDWDSGLVMSAIHQNPSIRGTFANEIGKINDGAVFHGIQNPSTGFTSKEGFNIGERTVYHGAITINARTYPGQNLSLEEDRAGITFHNPGRSAGLLYLENGGLRFLIGNSIYGMDMTLIQ